LRRGRALEQKREKEWKMVLCPGGRGRNLVMCEWEIASEKGRILKRTLKLIDCCNPQLTLFGGADCNWGCEGVIMKRES